MDDLGPELITRILECGRFSPFELCHLSMLNRDWREAVNTREIWKEMHLHVPDYSAMLLRRIAAYSQNLAELRVSRSTMHPRALTLMFR